MIGFPSGLLQVVIIDPVFSGSPYAFSNSAHIGKKAPSPVWAMSDDEKGGGGLFLVGYSNGSKGDE